MNLPPSRFSVAAQFSVEYSFISRAHKMKTGLTNCQERIDAAEKGEKFYRISKPCRNGHFGKRYTAGGGCYECTKERGGVYGNSTMLSRAENENSVQTVVYVVEAGEYCKIGIAENVATRFQVLRTHCPIPATLVYCTASMARIKALKIERRCQAMLAAHHCHGEWFKCPSSEVVRAINVAEPEVAVMAEKDQEQDLLLLSQSV